VNERAAARGKRGVVRTIRRSALVVTVLGILSLPGQALASEPQAPEPTQAARDEARSRFARAVELYADGDFKLALIEFERAYSLVPNYRLLYNIGQVNLQLHSYAKALDAFQAYLSEGGQDVPKARRDEVERTTESLRQRTASLRVRAQPAGAEILVDDAAVGVEPLARPLTLDAGEHRVTARKPGFVSATKAIVLAGRDEATLDLSLAPEPIAGTRSDVREQGHTGRSAWFYAGWAGTAGLGIAAAVTGGLALSDAAKLKDLRENQPSTSEELAAASDRAHTMAVATDVLIVSTAVAASAMVYFTWLRPAPKAESAPRVSVGSAGPALWVRGSF
jgi:tetratricopeptide (TPR) repeat protein